MKEPSTFRARPRCFLRGPTWAFGDYSTSKQVDRKDIFSLIASRDKVNIRVADPSILFSNPVRGAVILIQIRIEDANKLPQ